jgi:hypothetical protein
MCYVKQTWGNNETLYTQKSRFKTNCSFLTYTLLYTHVYPYITLNNEYYLHNLPAYLFVNIYY